MGNEAANVAVLKEAYARWHDSKGTSDHWMELVADDIKFGSLARGAAPQLAFAKSYNNRQALADYFAGLRADWEMIHYTVGEFVAQGDAVFMHGSTSWRHKRTGKTFETPKVDFWRFRDDGKVVEFYEFYDTASVIAAAGD
jgi:ketosteroid isomerase-like protein